MEEVKGKTSLNWQIFYRLKLIPKLWLLWSRPRYTLGEVEKYFKVISLLNLCWNHGCQESRPSHFLAEICDHCLNHIGFKKWLWHNVECFWSTDIMRRLKLKSKLWMQVCILEYVKNVNWHLLLVWILL